jgi:hypothetical protein
LKFKLRSSGGDSPNNRGQTPKQPIGDITKEVYKLTWVGPNFLMLKKTLPHHVGIYVLTADRVWREMSCGAFFAPTSRLNGRCHNLSTRVGLLLEWDVFGLLQLIRTWCRCVHCALFHEKIMKLGIGFQALKFGRLLSNLDHWSEEVFKGLQNGSCKASASQLTR